MTGENKVRPEFIDITGERFGALTVLRRAPNSDSRHARWVCRCDCRNETTVDGSKLRGGYTRTCGCRMLEPKPEPPRPPTPYPARIDEATYVRAGLRLLGPDARRRAQQVRLEPGDPLKRIIQQEDVT